MSNIINAIINLVNSNAYELGEYMNERNRANSMGDALEEFVKDMFAGTYEVDNEQERMRILDEHFSYLGNTNNPPDSMLWGGDAIEVKKIEGNGSALALNSSYPKAKLYSDDPKITRECQSCEDWDEKDIIYSVGVVNGRHLKQLCFVYGVDYAANRETYQRIADVISSGIQTIPDVQFGETKELGRVNRVDPLGITKLRIRGMWTIENPFKVFSYVHNCNTNDDFSFMAIINTEKYNSFDNVEELEYLSRQNENLNITDVLIKNPNNPARTKEAKLITFSE